MDKYNPDYLDEEEKELIEGIEQADLSGLRPPAEAEQKAFQEAARRYVHQETKMNIRIHPDELTKIKREAEKEGLKYQTFIKSILHKYVTGQLVERDKKAS